MSESVSFHERDSSNEAIQFWIPPGRPRYWEMGVPVHHDPVHGIVANPEISGGRPLVIFVVCDNHAGGHVERDPYPAEGGRLGPTMTDIAERGFLYL